MTLQTFNFEFWSPRPPTYPEGSTLQMGKGHQFAVKPLLPIQRSFTLDFSGLRWLANGSSQYVSSISPTQNALKLLEFYEEHMMWKRFTLPHPVYGNLTVRFKSPVAVGKSVDGGSGWTEAFEVTMIEQP